MRHQEIELLAGILKSLHQITNILEEQAELAFKLTGLEQTVKNSEIRSLEAAMEHIKNAHSDLRAAAQESPADSGQDFKEHNTLNKTMQGVS